LGEARGWIERLRLRPHPEGGHYRETYRSPEVIAAEHLPPGFGGPRALATAIYYLLEAGDVSAFHRIRQDEVWHWYDGGALLIHVIADDGRSRTHRLGTGEGEEPQAVVRAGELFAAEVAAGDFVLAGCTVAPGFEFADFQMPARRELLARHPSLRPLIERLTRPDQASA